MDTDVLVNNNKMNKKKLKRKEKIKPKSFVSRWNSFFFFFFLPGADAPRVYVRAWTLCCFDSLINPQNLSREGADRVGGQPRGDRECTLSGVTNCGRVWRKVPESEADWSVTHTTPPPPVLSQTPA